MKTHYINDLKLAAEIPTSEEEIVVGYEKPETHMAWSDRIANFRDEFLQFTLENKLPSIPCWISNSTGFPSKEQKEFILSHLKAYKEQLQTQIKKYITTPGVHVYISTNDQEKFFQKYIKENQLEQHLIYKSEPLPNLHYNEITRLTFYIFDIK